MPIKIGRYKFEGPFSSQDDVKEREGIFTILSRLQKNLYLLLDIGESDNLKKKVLERKKNILDQSNINEAIFFAVNYTQNLEQPGREMIVRDIKYEYEKLNFGTN